MREIQRCKNYLEHVGRVRASPQQDLSRAMTHIACGDVLRLANSFHPSTILLEFCQGKGVSCLDLVASESALRSEGVEAHSFGAQIHIPGE
eukprot:1587487-Amphidinium_carterae.1